MKFHREKLIHLTILFLLPTTLFITQASQPPFSCDSSNPETKFFKFCQTSLPVTERVDDLISHLTIDEKISQLDSTAPGIPRLGIPAYQWWSEALHGVGEVGLGIDFNGLIRSATSFPQVIVTAASFDEQLWYRIGQVLPILIS